MSNYASIENHTVTRDGVCWANEWMTYDQHGMIYEQWCTDRGIDPLLRDSLDRYFEDVLEGTHGGYAAGNIYSDIALARGMLEPWELMEYYHMSDADIERYYAEHGWQS